MSNIYTVTFKAGDEVVFKTSIHGPNSVGEPHDTARIYADAFQQLKTAIYQGKAPADSVTRSDITEVTYPNGNCIRYTDEEMGAVLHQYHELIKLKPTKENIIVVARGGGISGAISPKAGVPLSALSEEDFGRVTEILDLLQTHGAPLEYMGGVSNMTHHIRLGNPGDTFNNMAPIFTGRTFARTPKVVGELASILEKYREIGTAGMLGRPGTGFQRF